MFKQTEEQFAVLGVCVDKPAMYGRVEGLNFVSATNSRRAIDMLRMLHFDFLLVNIKLPDASTWDFLRHLKTGFSSQKWALVGGPITEQQEITARMFGATTIFDTTPTSHELLNLTARMRERAIAHVLNGRVTGAPRALRQKSMAL
jgi:DNA-binding NarL/FixJ family response regulator